MEGLGSSLSYPLEETELAWGESRQQEWEFLPSLCSGGRPPLLAGSRVGPLPGRMITHQSSHPPAQHLPALLPHPLHRPPPQRSCWVHQPLPDIWGRNRQTDSSPCRGLGGMMVRVQSQAATSTEKPRARLPTTPPAGT